MIPSLWVLIDVYHSKCAVAVAFICSGFSLDFQPLFYRAVNVEQHGGQPAAAPVLRSHGLGRAVCRP